MMNSSKVGWTANEMAIHSHAVNVGVPDVAEADRKLGLAASVLGAGPRLDHVGIFKSRDWAMVKGQFTVTPSDSCGS